MSRIPSVRVLSAYAAHSVLFLNLVQRYKKNLEYANFGGWKSKKNMAAKCRRMGRPDVCLWSERRSPLLLPFELLSQGNSPCDNELSGSTGYYSEKQTKRRSLRSLKRTYRCSGYNPESMDETGPEYDSGLINEKKTGAKMHLNGRTGWHPGQWTM